jgi:hypothetical protein
MDLEFVEKYKDLVDEWKKYKQYKEIDDSYLLSKMPEMERHKKEIEKLKTDLAILNEQQGEEVDTTQEVAKTHYWQGMIDNHNKNNLSAIESQERLLAQMKQRFQSVMTYYEGRLKTANEILEKKQNKKSKPHIKLNYKIKELEDKVNKYNEDCKGCYKFREINEMVQKEYELFKLRKERQTKKVWEQKPPESSEMNSSTPQSKNTIVVPKKEEVKSQHPPVIQNTKEVKPKKTPKSVAVRTEEQIKKSLADTLSVSSD